MEQGIQIALPSGTVTFVLTDIERSTALWETYGEAMGRSVERHEAIIAEATERHGGILVRSRGEGDSCFCVFPRPSGAVNAVLDVQSALVAEAWEGPAVRVRIAVHTGSAELRDDQYYGTAVNRCARLRGIAHGGQTLLSSASAALVRDLLPSGVTLEDLGSHRLPDLTEPERVYQLCHPDVPDVFPALASLDSLPNNLPVQLTRFVDRERELEEIKELIGTHRLVTLTGPGGSGKTRLALQTAGALMESYPDGVWLVDLTAVTDPSLVTAQLASTLGVREQPGRTLVDTATDHLARRTVLLVLDNCEHIVADAASVATHLLARAPRLAVIATSRQPLAVEGEVVRPVLPLAAPDDPVTDAEEVLSYGAVQLLRDRGALACPGFEVTASNAAAVASICRRLDGIPLAIEFAAARLGSLGPAELARRLEDTFGLLGRRSGPERHQTLEAAVRWSYELLADLERLLFRRLSVFIGQFSLDAAEAVCADDELVTHNIADVLSRLVERSLVFADPRQADTSYRMLATTRTFALARLEDSGEADVLRSNHLRWFVALAGRTGSQSMGSEAGPWFDMLGVVHNDIRTALTWALNNDPRSALRLAAGLGPFWDTRGHWTESRGWLEAAIAVAPDESIDLAHALRWAGNFAYEQREYASAREMIERALAIYRALSDELGVAHSLTNLGMIVTEQGDAATARRYFDEGLEMVRRRGHEQHKVGLLINLAMSAQARGADATDFYQEALALSREYGHLRGTAACLVGLASIAQSDGDPDRARELYDEGLALFRGLQDKRGVAATLSGSASMVRAQGKVAEAFAMLSEAAPLYREVGDRPAYAIALTRLGTLASLLGDLSRARGLYTEALGVQREVGDMIGLGATLVLLARVARMHGDVLGAESWLARALDVCRRSRNERTSASVLEEFAGVVAPDDPERSARLFGAAQAARERSGAHGRRTAQELYERDVDAVRERLDPDGFARSWAEGSEMDAMRALDYASGGRLLPA